MDKVFDRFVSVVSDMPAELVWLIAGVVIVVGIVATAIVWSQSNVPGLLNGLYILVAAACIILGVAMVWVAIGALEAILAGVVIGVVLLVVVVFMPSRR